MKKRHAYLIVALLILIVVTFASFMRIGGNDFINFDDEGYITENDHIKSGINPGSIKWAFNTVVLNNWVPLAMISHMLDWSLFGANASGHHIVSLLWHIGAVIFLFLFFQKTTNNIWSAAFAAAFFALHPLRVESVAWASERKDVLSMFFGMAALWAYAFYAEKQKIFRYFLCLILFTLSLLAKSMLITLPFVFLLLDYWPLGRWPKEITATKNLFFNRLMWEKIPFILLTIISSIITFWVQYEANSVYPSFPVRIFNAIVAYAAYLGKTFWPVGLTLNYFNYFFIYSFPVWQIIGSFFILIGITAAVIYFFKKKPFLFVGWFWYLGTLIPVIGLVPTSALIADHYTYLPSIGIAVMLAWGIPSLIKSEILRKKILFQSAVVVLSVLVVLTWQQCGYWKNSVEFWNFTVKVTKDNVTAYSRLGHAYANLGQYQQAMQNFNKIIRLKPDDHTAYNGRGIIYSLYGQYQLAIENYNEAIRLQPIYVPAYYNRGMIYNNLGQYQLAIEDFNNTIRLSPVYFKVYKDQNPSYSKVYNEASPNYFMVYNERGIIYGKLNQYKKAIDDFNKAIELNPNYFKAYNNRAFAYANLRQYQLAIEDYNKAIKLQSDYAKAYSNRAIVYLKQGNK
jgi:tetratricopeptide (TPR) repeat protein